MNTYRIRSDDDGFLVLDVFDQEGRWLGGATSGPGVGDRQFLVNLATYQFRAVPEPVSGSLNSE